MKHLMLVAICLNLCCLQIFGQEAATPSETKAVNNKIFIGLKPAQSFSVSSPLAMDFLFDYQHKVGRRYGWVMGFSSSQFLISSPASLPPGAFHGVAGGLYPDRFLFDVEDSELTSYSTNQTDIIREMSYKWGFHFGIFYEFPLLFKERLTLRLSLRNRIVFSNGMYLSEEIGGPNFAPDGDPADPIRLFGFANTTAGNQYERNVSSLLDLGFHLDYLVTKNTSLGLTAIPPLISDDGYAPVFIHIGISF
jgi:hypothetical protein